ncbi:hypothetical protein B0H21DRAFT_826045 [Amylocystis lapponica]|nr:hypothetical protein B0H21DRAFT_826045 [Amylocystis lapponica]
MASAKKPRRHISLSACQDSQRTWEDGKGRSMTQMLIGILDKNPNPSFKDLMTSLSYSMHNMARSLHEWSRGKKKEVAVKKNSAEESAIPTELVNFQDPQLGSLTKLNMDQTFTM